MIQRFQIASGFQIRLPLIFLVLPSGRLLYVRKMSCSKFRRWILIPISKKVSSSAVSEEASTNTLYLSSLICVRCLSLNHLLCVGVGGGAGAVALFKGNRLTLEVEVWKSHPNHMCDDGTQLSKEKAGWYCERRTWMLDGQPQHTWREIF